MSCPPGSVQGTHGILACCPASCKGCGGKSCRLQPGGAEQCCALAIAKSGRRCSETLGAPCIPLRFARNTTAAPRQLRSSVRQTTIVEGKRPAVTEQGTGPSACPPCPRMDGPPASQGIRTYMPRTCTGGGMLAVNMSLGRFPRAFGIGLPHTGTSTLHQVLLRLGCCFATHNHPAFQSRSPTVTCMDRSESIALRTTGNRTSHHHQSHAHHGSSPPVELQSLSLAVTGTGSGSCSRNVIRLARSWQCLTDDPWASHWRALATAFPEAKLILTTVASPLHYGVSALGRGAGKVAFPTGYHQARMDDNEAVRAFVLAQARFYADHVRAVRARMRTDGRIVEVSWSAGDDMRSLASKLNISLAPRGKFDRFKMPHVRERHTGAQHEDNERLLTQMNASLCPANPWLCEEA